MSHSNTADRTKIRIPLYNFKYNHNQFKDDENSEFIGRKKQVDRFLSVLEGVSKRSGGGAYLIAGYRGAGKTSFVNKVLRDYENKKKDKRKCLDVRINLGSKSDLTPRQIMSNMLALLELQLKNTFTIKFWSWINWIFWPFLLLIFLDYAVLWGILRTRSGIGNEIFEQTSIALDYDKLLSQQGFLTFSLLLVILVFKHGLYLYKKNPLYILRKIRKLNKDIGFSREVNSGISSSWFSFGRQYSSPPLSENKIEQRLIWVLQILSLKYDVIFVFDELDKISQNVDKDCPRVNKSLQNNILKRMDEVNTLLGGLKSLITTAQAKMIFVAGREIYDAYLSERGNTSSLYESLFNTYIYIPSLLSDYSDNNHTVIDSMVETYICSKLMHAPSVEHKENQDRANHFKLIQLSRLIEKNNKDDERNKAIYILKIFVHFITLHSWGNMKRMTTLFETFIEENNYGERRSNILYTLSNDYEYELVFDTRDLQRLIFASQFYIPFHDGLSRTFTQSDDKLVVSSFAVFHYLLKFHGMSFSKNNVNRMYEALNIHASTELSRIIDTIITKVLRSQIRRIRNSMYRYRFSSLIEQEIHYITSISDYESAAFSFSLNSINNVKDHYLSILDNELNRLNDAQVIVNIEQMAELYLIIGSFNFWEKSFDEANLYYGYSEKILLKVLNKKNRSVENNTVIERNYSAIFLYIESLLKRGSVAERNENYTLAAGIYYDAFTYVKEHIKSIDNRDFKEKDSKWDILRQPYWSMLYLNLKRSPGSYRRKENLPEYPFADTDIYHYQLGTYFSFINNYQASIAEYFKVISLTKVLNVSRERSSYLGGNALIKAGMSLVAGISATIHKELFFSREIPFDKKIKKFHENLSSFDGTLEKSEDNTALSRLRKSTVTEKINAEDIKIRFLTNEANVTNKICASSINVYDALGLILEGAKSLENRQLYSLAAQGYISIVMFINFFQEALPIREIQQNDSKLKHLFISPDYEAITKESLDRAFYCQGMATGKCFTHSMKTLWKDNIGRNVKDYKHLSLENLRKGKFKENLSSPMYWHYSAFGQLTLALTYWTDFTWCAINNKPKDAIIKDISINDILPFGERFYSIMLWIKGRYYLSQVIRDIRNNYNHQKIIKTALDCAICLFHSSQYISQISSNEQNIILPPQFLLHYHQWELVHELRGLLKSKDDLRDIMTDELRNEKNTKDISARIFDYDLVKAQALESLKSVENMGDINSKARKEVFGNTYYLDDDYEDLIFTLDWACCHSMGITALVCRELINKQSDEMDEAEHEYP